MKGLRSIILGLFLFVMASGFCRGANIGSGAPRQGKLTLGIAIDVIKQPLKLEKHPTVKETDISYDPSTGEITYINEESSDYFSPTPWIRVDWSDIQHTTNLAVCSICYGLFRNLSVCAKLGIGDKDIGYTEDYEDSVNEIYGISEIGYENFKQGFAWGGNWRQFYTRIVMD